MVKDPDALVDFPVICFVIVSSDWDKSTDAISILGRFAYNPDEERFIIFGSIKENTESPLSTDARATEVMAIPAAASPIEVPSAAILVILLKFGSVCPAVWYLTIASVLIPVTPLKNLPGILPVFPPLTVNLSVIEKLGGVLSYKTVSAKKSACNEVLSTLEFW